MKLDSRIIEGKHPLTCFDTAQAQNFVGKKCYLTNDISIFSDLDSFKDTEGCSDAPYVGVIDRLTNINKELSMVFDTTFLRWKFCIPCEWVKEEPTPKHIDFEVAKKDKNFERCELYGEELLFDTKNNIFYTSDGNVHAYLTTMAQHRYNEEQTKDVIIEKKYRPYTLAEWIGQHAIGDVIRYRCKSQKIELRHMYVGYAYGIGTDIKNTTSGTLTLGVASYSLDYLLEDYEIEVNGEWLPFGVIDE